MGASYSLITPGVCVSISSSEMVTTQNKVLILWLRNTASSAQWMNREISYIRLLASQTTLNMLVFSKGLLKNLCEKHWILPTSLFKTVIIIQLKNTKMRFYFAILIWHCCLNSRGLEQSFRSSIVKSTGAQLKLHENEHQHDVLLIKCF